MVNRFSHKMFMGLTLLVTSHTALKAEGTHVNSNLDKAKYFFDHLDKNHMETVGEFYTPDAEFQDPVHKLKGAPAIRAYYNKLYQNVDSIRFEYKRASESERFVTLEWRMFLKTPSLNSGEEVTVDGASLITFDQVSGGKAAAHRDYFDMGEFIYERVPVLGYIVRYIKRKME